MLLLLIVGVGYRLIVRLPFDVYMICTMDPPEDPNDAFYHDKDYFDSLVNILYFYLSQSTLRIAICVNLMRWVILYLGLKSMSEKRIDRLEAIERWEIAARIVLWIIILIQVVATSLDLFVDNKDVSYYSLLWTNYIVVLIPILGYIIIYILLRLHYYGILKRNRGLFTMEEQLHIKKALTHTLMFFLAIIQMQIVRIFNAFILITMSDNNNVYWRVSTIVLFHVSEIVLIISLCHSIRTVLATLK